MSTSYHAHGDTALPPFATTSVAGSSSLYPASSSSTYLPTGSTASLSGTEYLRDVFNKRIRSLIYLKRSLQGQHTWFHTVQLNPNELAAAFDNDRMHKRTLRYSLLGLSLSSILEIANPADMAKAIVSLINELDGYTDDNIVSLTSGTGAANFGGQRPKMRSFFKSGKQTLKRPTAAQAISEFGTLDSSMGPASTLATNEQSSYVVAPNIPFQLDFFQTFFTLCDILTEVYYKILSFFPKEATGAVGPEPVPSHHGTFPRASSPPSSASRHTSQEHERSGSISQTFSSVADISGNAETSEKAAAMPSAAPAISGVTQELLLKADAKIKKTMHAQVKEIDMLARQLIKDELTSLEPLIKDLALDTLGGVEFGSSGGAPSTRSVGSGLPSTPGSSLPFGYASSSHSGSAAESVPSSWAAVSPGSSIRTGSSLPLHLRRPLKSEPRTSHDSAHHGHHQFHLASLADADSSTSTSIGSLIRSRSGRLRSAINAERPPSLHAQSGTPTSDSSLPIYPSSTNSPTRD